MPGMILKALADARAELHIDGEIGGWGVYAQDLRQQLQELGNVNDLTVYLNSPGGSVIEGLNIYNLLKRLDAHIKVIVTGLAASMGSVIAMAGDDIVMAEGTLFMIHNPWGGAMGEADDLRKVADILDKMKTSLVGVYENRTQLNRDELSTLMDAETWMDASEALEQGFITDVDASTSADNVISLTAARAQVNNLVNRQQEIDQLAACASAQWQENKTTGDIKVKLQTKNDVPVFKPKPLSAAIKAVNHAHNQLIQTKTTPPKTTPKNTLTKEDPAMPDTEKLAALKARNAAIVNLFAKHTQLKTLETQCLSDVELSIEQVKDKLLEAIGQSESPVGGFEMVQDAKDKAKIGMTKALEARAGLNTKDDEANEFRGYTLTEMARKVLQLAGATPLGDKMTVIGQAFTHSTGDFGTLLSNVANKSMLKGFDEAPEVFDQFTGVGELPDFKENTRTDLGHAPSLREVKPGQEFKSITLGDKGVTASLATYGELFSINRQAIINDDLGAFTRVPKKMGRAARRTVGDLVFAQLFLAAHYSADNEKTGSPLNSANLDALRVLMARRKENDITTGVRPAFLLVPETLAGTAKQTVEAEFMMDASAKNSRQPNTVRNLAQVISDYRLDDDDVARYYLLASAQLYDALDVLYLDGNPNPFLDQQAGWSIDGSQFKVRIDAAAKLWDNRSVARAKA